METRENLDESKKSPRKWNKRILIGIAMIISGLGLKVYNNFATEKDAEDTREDTRQEIMDAIRQSCGRDDRNKQVDVTKTYRQIRDRLKECEGEDGEAKDKCFNRLGK